MCSLNPADWIKICEMLLGPAPEDFEFEPKVRISPRAPLCASHAADCRGTAVRSASRGLLCNLPSRCMMPPRWSPPTEGVSLCPACPCVSNCPASRDFWRAPTDSPEA